ncbi:PREDICTED: vacuolar protein sorting-associated protein 13B isoform X1 [Vollenhovia emeryi]|uniref:vacuolar protein sorting-associated protein 13B isoform X1 n=1 Tax=Vollenhovia emeryi TaxID=411798 RepID=UPI0005F54034|nr:PREDICTED: vacuolar protein sorting-associated protein 13B isoform X1 [Vollenhovia emeryi]XP_011871180.1 PREDICTED: vacuolar protein sorting-associated protein 13B isoform X1 [Vollenhovia emeryi]XP_011871181.1 PREDICTED: vacuolar protein sorting-associated protein 13B isoform X1 [Vollenhovia emeryi]XP_011871182.1 PREDICTED: vacuolar protein sorting-associated protein 13B isoform X1 [Vollenhovia emeryi]
MFKLESYITPVILSYVEKYVKNFKPEQSQVSLWGGDASFQNLDLRLEVLEEQLNLPFVFVSGHIHELLIHVPWVKITSEPIVVTINTIECILKLKDENTTETNTTTLQKKKEIEQEEAPPGYIKSVVTKVINNITIHCNNLILKYVEEDIVLSINVRFLSMQTVDNKWEPAFAEVNTQEVMLRKVITIQDLTLCLDKMDASGKIEIYQDPVLYRCSMTIRMIINYHNNTSKRASITRLDLHCEKMEFSMTEQQVPMLLRLSALVLALQTKQFPPSREKSSITMDDRDDVAQDDTNQIVGTSTDAVGWGGWAWEMVSSVLPVDWDNNWSAEQQMAYSGHTIHLGVYIDDATLTFKTVESVKVQIFYKSRKLRYKSFLSLQLNGVVIDTLIQGIAMTSLQVGVACVQLYPRGTCSCGHVEVADGVQPPLYVTAGNLNTDHLKDSLFDKEAAENKGKKRDYKQGIDQHLTTFSVEKLLERCPAFVMDYVYYVELSDEVTPEKLLELGSNFEYSNFPERRVIRYVTGDLTVRLCSGIFHRIDTIKQAAAKYDYNPYLVMKPDPFIDELPPVTLEEYEALRENVSMTETKFVLKRASLQLQLADHCVTGIPRQHKTIETRITPLSLALTDDPFVSIECDEAIATVVQPMYPFRLVACASKLTELSPEMFTQCHAITDIQVTGVKSQLHLTKICDTSIVMPYSVEASSKILLYPQYWRDIDMIQKSYSFQSDSITVTGTKAKLMAAASIITSVFDPTSTTNPLTCSTLFNDACQERCPVYLELYLENINCKNVSSSVTISNEVNVNSIKVFALSDSQQAFILSGPENHDSSDAGNVPLLSIVVQFPKNIETQTHPSLVSFKISEIRASLDPLFFEWLEYQATYHKSGSVHVLRSDSQQLVTEGTSSDTGTRKKFASLHESVHSSSDKEKKRSAVTEKSKTLRNDETQKKSEFKTEGEQQNLQKSGLLVRLAESYSWWCSLVLNGYIGHIIIYIPSNTMSGIGADGIEEAKDRALIESSDLQIMIIKLPSLLIHSSNLNAEILSPYLQSLPAKLPESMWTHRMQSFPWTLSLIDFHCYTLQQHTQKNFIKKVTLNATVALTTKTAATESNTLTALSVCVHIDNSPIIISLSEDQVIFMSSIISNVMKVLQTLCDSRKDNIIVPQMSNEMQVVLPAIPQTPSTPTQIIYQEDTNSTMSTSKDDLGHEKDGLVVTAWIQWTITKVAIKLYIMEQEDTSSLKLMLELEDIITSLDLQSVYMQLKNKITTATIFHYIRGPYASNWDVGEYAGLVLCGREDSLEKGDDSGFLSFTLTRAKSGNVYTRWGTHARHKPQKKELLLDSTLSTKGYISEILIKMQMVDIILPISVISKYTQLVKPFTCLGSSIEKSESIRNRNMATPLIDITNLNNESLPLIHLEFKGFRLMMPTSTDTSKLQHDLLMLQLDGIRITPDAENPICRTPLRTDIYQLAARANMLNVPGSAVEDRQYQISVKGVCAYTTTWKNYQLSINKRMSQSYLYTMNENPALEWNKLGNGSSLDPYFSTSPVLTKFDLCLIIAPAVTFKGDTIVCGSAVEVNCITDIELTINLDQIKLISTLNNEFITLLSGNFEKMDERHSSNYTIQRFPSGAPSIKPISWLKQTSDDSDIDFTKDSGVDFEMSSMHSTIIGRSTAETMVLPPFEFLVNCGKITFILYEVQSTFLDLEDNADIHKTDCEEDNDNVKQPLLYLMINQPNVYFSQQHLSKKIQISCFDVTTALGDAQNLNVIPSEKDFKIYMIETKHGDPHPDTGIPPSFATIKSEMILCKNRQFFIEMGRPTKVHLSLSRLNQLYDIRNKVLSCFIDDDVAQVPAERETTHTDSQNLAAPTRSRKFSVPDLHLNTRQIVLSLKTDTGAEIITSLASLNGSLSTLLRPDRIYSNISIDSFIVSAILNGNIKVLLNPWCCNVTTCLLWESSYSSEITPQIQIQADSESLYLNFGPDQIKIMKMVMRDCQLLLSELASLSTGENKNEKQLALSTEQHYKDDLKAGAFQFVDGTADELPFPYQVVFFIYPQQAMAWRYPQSRMLTRIHISPVPFEAADADGNYIDKVPCVLEYWSDNHMSYQRYADFYLSETDSYRLDLPEKAPARAVACVWRVVILSNGKRPLSKSIVSARALAACLRIDSYFNPLLIPNVQIALNIGVLHVSLYNHIDTSVYNNLPPPLDKYTLNGKIPEIQCFMSVEQKGAILVFNKWIDDSILLDIGGSLSVHVLDYSHLTMQEVLDALEGRFQLSLSDKVDSSLTCNPFTLKLGPAITHTLAVSTHLWLASFDEEEKSVVVLTRYVIANDSNISIRFGQSGTGDSILLESRQCNFYSWRQIGNQTIRISIEENAWVWSRPFPVNKDGIQVIEFNNSMISTAVFVNVTPLSATQKLVTFSGQLVISNQLTDNFEMRLVKYEEEVGSKVTVSKEVYPIPGKSFPSTIMLENNKKMAIRLRFTNLTHLSWTGDIPLQPNIKWGQPWLVKVPLQERGQFLSIWVRIVTQTIQDKMKILAVLSPLYMIKSHLPVPARVQMETPSLKTSSSTMVNGRGECQQLYCPGTFEHFHQLTFQLESGVSASNPYVPLSYSSVDQRKFFRRPEVEDIDKLLHELKDRKDEVKWPFQGDDTEEWISAEQPQTHVQVRYQDAGLVSSTLLLELQPWCFVMNSLGCHVSLVSEDTELCQIPHYGIVTPPKLESTFHVGVGIGDTYYTSQTLQLARPDWSQSFYMPRICGLVPVEGNIKTSVDCGASVSILNVGSSMHQDMRLVRIASSHVIANLTPRELCVATLAVHEEARDLQLPHDLTPCSLNISPSEDQRQGTPIVQWYTLHTESNAEPLVLYVSLSLGHRWSCPIRVDQAMSRRSVVIPNGSSTVPVIVTTQEDKGSTFVVIHSDDHPQLSIENACGFKILLGQADERGNEILPDSAHFAWICEVDSGATSHYSLPCVSNRLPDTAVPSASNVLLFSTVQNDQVAEKANLRWSRGVNLSALSSTPIDQYLRLPLYGDVKLIMHNRCYTTHISIVPISQIEISAQDIRSRLLRKKSAARDHDTVYNNPPQLRRSEEDKLLSYVQSSSSSTSLTSFFSAQEDILAAEQTLGSSAKQLIPKMADTKTCTDEDRFKSPGDSTNSREGSVIVYLRACTIVILHDVNENAQRIEVASLSMTDLVVTVNSKARFINLYCYIGDLQLDNQLFDQGGFDFPVVLINQNPLPNREIAFYSNNCLTTNMERIKQDSLIAIEYIWEINGNMIASKEYRMKIAPISAYIEDTYITQLLDYATSMIPSRLVLGDGLKKMQTIAASNAMYIPDYIMIDSKILSKPLRLQNFVIEPLSILLSVHTSMRLYVALDHSPLYFGTFERKNLLTTPYRLGNALTMHYLSGAIFGAGWVVGSLEILGSPGGLAQALGSGLRDFVSMPFQGLLQGPWGFIVGITHGSASLMKHVTAGTVNSVTKLASSVARNLDRLTLDEEHLQRQEESRRMRPQGMAQGLYQGLTGLGMSLLAAVAGLAHHPLQQVWSGEATTKSLVTGVGLGLVGVVTKPLSGAAELVALTGQGLLQGAGWNSLPTPRQRPIVQYTTGNNSTSVRYTWRLSPLLDHSHDSILHVTSADYVIHQGSNRAVTLVLTRQALLLVNMAEDSVERIFSLKELTSVDHITDSTMLCLYCPPTAIQLSRPLSPAEHEMNQEMRARVEEYVRTSSTGLASVSTNSDRQSDIFERASPHPEHTLTFYVCPDTRNYLLSLFNIAKRQNQCSGFAVL